MLPLTLTNALNRLIIALGKPSRACRQIVAFRAERVSYYDRTFKRCYKQGVDLVLREKKQLFLPAQITSTVRETDSISPF